MVERSICSSIGCDACCIDKGYGDWAMLDDAEIPLIAVDLAGGIAKPA
ncbi:hypothetical protein [Sagittula sp. SSi028]